MNRCPNVDVLVVDDLVLCLINIAHNVVLFRFWLLVQQLQNETRKVLVITLGYTTDCIQVDCIRFAESDRGKKTSCRRSWRGSSVESVKYA